MVTQTGVMKEQSSAPMSESQMAIPWEALLVPQMAPMKAAQMVEMTAPMKDPWKGNHMELPSGTL